MHRIIIGFIACWALLGLFATTANAEKADNTTRMVIQKLITALKAQNLEEVMKIVDVPWVYKDGVVRDRQELRRYFKRLLAVRDFSQMTYDVSGLSYDAPKGEYLVRLKVQKGGADEFTARIRYRVGDVKVVSLLD